MADDEQDALDTLEREASDFTKVRSALRQQFGANAIKDAEIDRIRKAFQLDA